MTTETTAGSITPDERALRFATQIALALLALVVAWALASALAPEPTIDGEGARSLLTMPFLASCGAAIALFAVDGFVFERSQLTEIGPRSIMAAVSAGSAWFVLGVLTADPFTTTTMLHLVFAAILVAALIGAVVAVVWLAVRKLA